MPAIVAIAVGLCLVAGPALAQPASDVAAPSPALRQIAQAEKSLARDRTRAETHD